MFTNVREWKIYNILKRIANSGWKHTNCSHGDTSLYVFSLASSVVWILFERERKWASDEWNYSIAYERMNLNQIKVNLNDTQMCVFTNHQMLIEFARFSHKTLEYQKALMLWWFPRYMHRLITFLFHMI